MSNCQFCHKVLSKEKGEEDHGCLDCFGYIYLVNDVYVCFHCTEIENRKLMNFRVKLNTFYPLRGGYGGMGYRELIYISDNKDWTPVFALWVGTRPLDIHGSRVRIAKKDDKRVRGVSLSYKQYFVDVLWRGIWKTFEEINGE